MLHCIKLISIYKSSLALIFLLLILMLSCTEALNDS